MRSLVLTVGTFVYITLLSLSVLRSLLPTVRTVVYTILLSISVVRSLVLTVRTVVYMMPFSVLVWRGLLLTALVNVQYIFTVMIIGSITVPLQALQQRMSKEEGAFTQETICVMNMKHFFGKVFLSNTALF